MRSWIPLAQSSLGPSSPLGSTYIYSIASLSPRHPDLTWDVSLPVQSSHSLVITTSDDSLILLHPESLQPLPDLWLKNVHERGLSVVKPLAKLGEEVFAVVSAGGDGLVKTWDLRTPHAPAAVFSVPVNRDGSKDGISALETHGDGFTIVAGTELEGNGPGDVKIHLWDTRFDSGPKLSYTESHTDTITELRFLPYPNSTSSNVLLSGSTDGLVTVFDTTKTDEEDAVLQVINHGSAVHHTGLVGSDIYALGTDETLSFYAQQNQDDEAAEPEPHHLGDLRQLLGCDYVMKIRNHPTMPMIAIGSHSEGAGSQNMKLVPLNNPQGSTRPTWQVDAENAICLEGGHGEELVRDYLVDDDGGVVWTAGEDGVVRAWKKRSKSK
jgi:WD40 repeat protein